MTCADWLWPGHAYVPGRTARHQEGWADAVCGTVRPGMDARALSETSAFRHGLRYLEHGFYWEAHEMLEPVWMALPEGSAERHFVQGMIQVANGRLKMCMGRPKAALRLCGLARGLLPEARDGAVMGVPVARMHGMIDSLEADVKNVL